MKSFLSRALTGVVLLSSSVLVFAQPAITSFDGFQGRLGPARMTPLSEYSTSPYGYRQGVSTDRSEYGLWRSPGRYRNPGSEDVVSCSALGCPNNPPDPNRTPVVELPDGNRIDLDLVRRLKDEEPPVTPRVKPKSIPRVSNYQLDIPNLPVDYVTSVEVCKFPRFENCGNRE